MGKSRHPSSTFARQACGPLWWFRTAIARTVLCEICSLPFRIALILSATCHAEDSFAPESSGALHVSTVLAYIEGRRRLERGPNRQLFGRLNCRLYSRAFDDGATWILRNMGTEPQAECRQRNQQIAFGESISDKSAISTAGGEYSGSVSVRARC